MMLLTEMEKTKKGRIWRKDYEFILNILILKSLLLAHWKFSLGQE